MSRKRSPNFEMVLRAAQRLGPLLDRVAFLGGAAVELLLTDPAAPAVRIRDSGSHHGFQGIGPEAARVRQ